MFDMILKGGFLMIPIILCGLLATFFIVERLFYFYVTKKRDAKLMYDLKSSLSSKDFETAKINCVEAGTPTALVIKKAIECRNWDAKDMEDVVQAEMEMEIPKFEHFLTPLGTIANIATLLGLLGTVTGISSAFGLLGASGGNSNPEALSGSIGEALITTVAGLIVSIPAVIFNNYFNSRVNKRIAQMESDVTSAIIKISGREDKYEI